MATIGIDPTDAVANTAQNAVANGDVSSLKAIAPLTANTSMATAVDNTINGMDKAINPAKRIIQATNDAGGINTPDGRIAATKSLLNEYQTAQPEKSFMRGLAMGFMGDPNAYKAMSAGVQENFMAPGMDGNFYRVVKNSNSGIPSAVFDSNGNLVPLSQAQKLGITQLNDVTQTLGYKAAAIKNEQYTNQNIKEIGAANAWASGYQTISKNNEQIVQGLNQLKASGVALPADVLASINSVASRSGSLAVSYSKAINDLKNSNDSTSQGNAIKVANELAGQMGAPKIVSVDASHNVHTDDNKTYSIQDFSQKANSLSGSQQSENAWRAGKAEIVNSEWYKRMASTPEGQKMIPIFEDVYNRSASNDVLKKQLVSTHGWMPFLTPNMPFDPSKSVESSMAQTMLDQGNAIKAKQFADKMSNMMQSGIPIIPGSVMNSYSQNEGKLVDQNVGNSINAALQSFKPTQPKPSENTSAQIPNLPSSQDQNAVTTNTARNKLAGRSVVNPARKSISDSELVQNLLAKHKR